RAGSHRTECRHRLVPHHGHGLLAPSGGGGAGAGGGVVMVYDALPAGVHTLLQQETGEQWCRGGSLQRLGKSAPVEPIPTMSDVCPYPMECQEMAWGKDRKCTGMLAELTYRTSQGSSLYNVIWPEV